MSDAYRKAGVNIDAATATVAAITDGVQSTYDERVLSGIGGFGGVFDASSLGPEAVLVASTDTCGTKPLVAAAVGHWANLGRDIIAHGVNDVLVQGARPLFALDIVSTGSLEPSVVEAIVAGMIEECRLNGCALLGGETAEVPGLMNGYDVAGTMIGVAQRQVLLPAANIEPGDVLVGLPSNGLHTNGYSLARSVADSVGYDAVIPDDGRTLGDALMAPHLSYYPMLSPALEAGALAGLAHITGGGFLDNLPRVLPENCGAHIDTTAWEIPPLFGFLVQRAELSSADAYRTFNMGIGMVAVVKDLGLFNQHVTAPVRVIGEVTGTAGVSLA